MDDQDTPAPDTPEVFLAALGASLQAQHGSDAELAAILAAHLIKTDPAQDSVSAAKVSILKLAAERARLQDGTIKHDSTALPPFAQPDRLSSLPPAEDL